jgi:hypothetical protein
MHCPIESRRFLDVVVQGDLSASALHSLAILTLSARSFQLVHLPYFHFEGVA